MKRLWAIGLGVSMTLVVFTHAQAKPLKTEIQAGQVIKIPTGSYTPLYRPNDTTVTIDVSGFSIDRHLVTNRDFVAFVEKQPGWSKESAPVLYRDDNYLGHWNGSPARPKASQAKVAVTQVSWFAAEEYCEWQGGRLPTVDEWEYVAAADEKSPDATRDPVFVDKLLAWYSRPAHTEVLTPIGKGKPNYYGVEDMHNLVWEWTYDFNSVFVTGDNRQDADDMKNLFCGGAAATAQNKSDYAAFMRYALRNSLQASYTLERLGFRCAYEQ